MESELIERFTPILALLGQVGLVDDRREVLREVHVGGLQQKTRRPVDADVSVASLPPPSSLSSRSPRATVPASSTGHEQLL